MFPLKRRELIRGCKKHIMASLGCAADYVARYVTLYAPFDGTLTRFHGRQGGNWARLVRDNGDRLEFAHLRRYIGEPRQVKAGDKIAITGNTGLVTTGPHLHIQIFTKNGTRFDPERYQWDNDEMQQIEDLKETIRELNTEIGTVTEERDDGNKAKDKMERELNTEIGKVTAQRDACLKGDLSKLAAILAIIKS